MRVGDALFGRLGPETAGVAGGDIATKQQDDSKVEQNGSLARTGFGQVGVGGFGVVIGGRVIVSIGFVGIGFVGITIVGACVKNLNGTNGTGGGCWVASGEHQTFSRNIPVGGDLERAVFADGRRGEAAGVAGIAGGVGLVGHIGTRKDEDCESGGPIGTGDGDILLTRLGYGLGGNRFGGLCKSRR